MPRHTPILTAEDVLAPLTPVSVQPISRRRQGSWMMGLSVIAALLGFLLF